MSEHELELFEVNSRYSFMQFWDLFVEDFNERDLSWSGHCMFGLLDLFSRCAFTATKNRDYGDPNISWAALANMFREFRRLQMDT